MKLSFVGCSSLLCVSRSHFPGGWIVPLKSQLIFNPIISFNVPPAGIPSSCFFCWSEYSCLYPVFVAASFCIRCVWFDLWVDWFGQVLWLKFWMLVSTSFYGRLFQRWVLELLLVLQTFDGFIFRFWFCIRCSVFAFIEWMFLC